MTRVNKQLAAGAVLYLAAGVMVLDALGFYWRGVEMPGEHWVIYGAVVLVGLWLWETAQQDRSE